MSWFHPEEATRLGVLTDYEEDHPGTRYLVEFASGSSHVCVYDTCYQSDNTGDLDIEMDDPLYDEFYQVAMEVVDVARVEGTPIDGLTLDYRDFPIRITDIDTGRVVYPAGEHT